MAASFEEVVFNIGIVTNDLEEDLEEEKINILNGDYDSVGAGGSGNNNAEIEEHCTKRNSFSPPLEFIFDSLQNITSRHKQYRLSLQKSLVISPLFIIYCCAKDSFLS